MEPATIASSKSSPPAEHRHVSRLRSLICRPELFLVCLALLLVAGSLVGRGRSEIEVPLSGMSGAFAPGNSDNVPSTAPPVDGKFWSSWAATDTSLGTLSMGPFPAPGVVEFQLAGYPNAAGNRILFENTSDGSILQPRTPSPDEVWKTVRISLPDSWQDDPIILRVLDRSAEPPGWIAISNPQAIPAWAAWWNGIIPKAAAMLMVGCAALFLLSAAAVLFRRSSLFAGPGRMMAAAAVVMAVAYAIFWAYFFNRRLGLVAVTLGFVAAAIIWLLRRADVAALWRDPDWFLPAVIALAVAAFVTGILFSYSVSRPAYQTASLRWSEGFPPDNVLPSVLAERLSEGESLKPFWGEWLSSDRPPLQAGWILFVSPIAVGMDAHPEDASQFAGIWFQLLWVPALWALVRRLGLSPPASVLVVAAPILSGFFLINTTFVWPKLGGGALVLAAFLNWFRPPEEVDEGFGRFLLGGLQAGLGFLSHGSVVFALIPVGILALWRLRSHLWHWAAAAAVILLLALPWTAYQKLSDPPGDRLLKMHLGGIGEVDERPLATALREAYSAVPPERLVEAREVNARNLFRGAWSDLVTFDFGDTRAMREDDFFFPFFALGWWNLGFLVILAAILPPVRRRFAGEGEPLQYGLLVLGWAGLTLAVWVCLMFAPGSAINHQGSYTVQLVLFASLAAVLWKLHPAAFFAVLLAQSVVFFRLWLPPSVSFAGVSLRQDSLAVAAFGVGCIVLLATFHRARDRDQRPLLTEFSPWTSARDAGSGP